MAKVQQKFAFLDAFDKELSKMDKVSTSGKPPRYWHGFGNHAINKVMSGSFYNGIPQGRITAICGPSSAGKSFLVGNLCRQAQQDGAYILVVDSENALDDTFMGALGVDIESGYKYTSPITFAQTSKIVSNFITKYKTEVGDAIDAPPVLIVVDSLDGLQTNAQAEANEKGDIQFDRGQKPRMMKDMMMGWMQDIKSLNISIVVTKQVYRASQDQLLQGEGVWVIGDALRYPCSQIVLATRLKLKDEKTKAIKGIRMKIEGFKTRFCAPFNTITVEVPYEEGMSCYSGMFDIAIALGVIVKNGSWYQLEGTDKNLRSSDIESDLELMSNIVASCESKLVKHIDTFTGLEDIYEEDKGKVKKGFEE